MKTFTIILTQATTNEITEKLRAQDRTTALLIALERHARDDVSIVKARVK